MSNTSKMEIKMKLTTHQRLMATLDTLVELNDPDAMDVACTLIPSIKMNEARRHMGCRELAKSLGCGAETAQVIIDYLGETQDYE